MANTTPTGTGESGSPRSPGSRDPRLDAAISWTLTTAAALAFAVGAWSFQGLTAEVRALRTEITAINVRTSVIEAARYGDALKDLDTRVRALELRRKD